MRGLSLYGSFLGEKATFVHATQHTPDHSVLTNESSVAISVIVPVYNTEKYLARCLDSLLAQSFKSYEIILVDDGSTDSSPALCDSYASRFSHATVVHQKNQGLSGARNVGIAAAAGEYIGFVDSDDWVAPSFLETLYTLATSTNSDIAEVDYEIKTAPDTNGLTQHEKHVHERTLSGLDALKEMLIQERYAVWNKLYAKKLFHENEAIFPFGLTCEDRVANFKLLPRANQVAVSDSIEYYYFLNQGSISHDGLSKRGFDLIEADKINVDRARELGDEEILELAKDRAAKSSYSLLVKWARFGVTDSNLDEDAALQQLKHDFEINYSRLMSSPLSTAKKFVAWQLKHMSPVLRLEFRFYNALTKGRA